MGLTTVLCTTAKKFYYQKYLNRISSRVRHFITLQGHIYEEEWSQLGRISRLPIIHHEEYVCPLPPNHRFQMMKFHHLYKILLKDGVINEHKQVVRPVPISAELASGVHSADYVHRFFSGKTTVEEQRETGFKWTPGLASRVRYETGGTLLAAKLSLQCGLACSTGGGTHHAYPHKGSGFCLINDLAIAADTLRTLGLAHKVLVVDLDVHQGDGTAFIFQNNPNVFTLSMHCQSNFPVRKQKSDLDIGVDDRIGDSQYMHILNDHLPSVLDSFHPDIVLYDAGVDPHQKDQLGKLNITDEGLFERDMYVLKAAICRGIPVVTVIGGGYDDIMELSARHTIIHRVATHVWDMYL